MPTASRTATREMSHELLESTVVWSGLCQAAMSTTC